MHLLLTDRLACPRCGPAFGLILLARTLEERRVLEGELGCPNCRQRYAVRAGLADLRATASSTTPPSTLEAATAEEALRVAALVGVREGPAQVLLHGRAARFAPTLAEQLPDVHWIADHPAVGSWSEQAGVERVRTGGRLPFFDRSLRAVVVEGPDGGALAEASRVVQSRGRLVLLDPAAEEAGSVEAHGFVPLLDDPRARVWERR
ncbi:MAG: Trm112 family protein [Gemmatimonadetes bacterium]|nr:Trm112 family protein [Gemmatimonadota bacterium]